ncbi:hypothetical protein GCM10018987_54860 [Streptomyces cremeus]
MQYVLVVGDGAAAAGVGEMAAYVVLRGFAGAGREGAVAGPCGRDAETEVRDRDRLLKTQGAVPGTDAFPPGALERTGRGPALVPAETLTPVLDELRGKYGER